MGRKRLIWRATRGLALFVVATSLLGLGLSEANAADKPWIGGLEVKRGGFGQARQTTVRVKVAGGGSSDLPPPGP